MNIGVTVARIIIAAVNTILGARLLWQQLHTIESKPAETKPGTEAAAVAAIAALLIISAFTIVAGPWRT